jgi:hypothetical protein
MLQAMERPSALFSANANRSPAKASKLISVRLPAELLVRLSDIGNEEGLTMSDTIRLVLERGINSRNAARRSAGS